MGRGWHWGGGQCEMEREMERRAMGGRKMGKREMLRGERGMRWGGGGGEEEARGGEISQMDMMGCLGGHGLLG